MEDKVVKCNEDKCGQHFMLTKKVTECPFCHTVYSEVKEKAEEKVNKKKLTVKTGNESFKISKR